MRVVDECLRSLCLRDLSALLGNPWHSLARTSGTARPSKPTSSQQPGVVERPGVLQNRGVTDGKKEQLPVASFGDRAKPVEQDELRAYLVRLDAMWASSDDRVDQADAFRKRLGSKYADGFRSLERMLDEAMDAADWASSAMDRLHTDAGDGQQAQYYAVIKGLCARALKTFGEVLWLLKGGYPDGATARVRTLHEIAVTISVIAVYGAPGREHPELIDRFIAHREAMVPRFAHSLCGGSTRPKAGRARRVRICFAMICC